nr:MAG TPA: Single-stranded DNA-binding protein [Caudoviricetes sp.]
MLMLVNYNYGGQKIAAIVTGQIRIAPRKRDYGGDKVKYVISVQHGYNSQTKKGYFIDCDFWYPMIDLAKSIQVGDVVLVTGLYTKRVVEGKIYETITADYVGVAGASAYIASPANAFYAPSVGENSVEMTDGQYAADPSTFKPVNPADLPF